jgi:hypothetical protein
MPHASTMLYSVSLLSLLQPRPVIGITRNRIRAPVREMH